MYYSGTAVPGWMKMGTTFSPWRYDEMRGDAKVSAAARRHHLERYSKSDQEREVLRCP
jgi:hypothetical protein